MSEPTTNSDGPRATVALVDAKVDTVLAEVRSGFKDVQRQLDAVAKVPERVARLEERVRDLERDSNWRRVNLPALLISAAALVVAVVSTL